MLVLTRKQNQKIHIGNDITIMVNVIEGNRVVLGIEAPKGIVIKRGELLTAALLNAEPIDQVPATIVDDFFDPLGDLMPANKSPNYVRSVKG